MSTNIVWPAMLSLAVSIAARGACAQPPPIQDNSFLIEEAYNQEPDVAQHIFTAMHFASPFNMWGLTFTQEVPLAGQRHQMSWTLPFDGDEPREHLRLGDVALHYRFQLLDGTRGLAVAPRASLILPTRTESPRGDGGALGVQFNLPVSVQASRALAFHFNAGATRLEADVRLPLPPNATQGTEKAVLTAYNLGASTIWFAHPNLNLLVEVVRNFEGELNSEGDLEHPGETILNPGVRVAINTAAGQFVPGVGIPVRFADGETDAGVFLYLSFEHSVSRRESR